MSPAAAAAPAPIADAAPAPRRTHGGRRAGAGRPRAPLPATRRRWDHVRAVARSKDPVALDALAEQDLALIAAWCLASAECWHEAGLLAAELARTHHHRPRCGAEPPRPHPRSPNPVRGGRVHVVGPVDPRQIRRLERRIARYERHQENLALREMLIAAHEAVVIEAVEEWAPPAKGRLPFGNPDDLNCSGATAHPAATTRRRVEPAPRRPRTRPRRPTSAPAPRRPP